MPKAVLSCVVNAAAKPDIEVSDKLGVIVCVTPPIVTVKDPKSVGLGIVPKLTPVNKALCVPPKLAPIGFPTVSTALVDKPTLLINRLLDELNDKDVPLTETVRSVVPSMD